MKAIVYGQRYHDIMLDVFRSSAELLGSVLIPSENDQMYFVNQCSKWWQYEQDIQDESSGSHRRTTPL